MTGALRVDEFGWGRMEWLAEGGDKGLSLARMIVAEGATSPAHRHQNCNEVIHLLSGAVALRYGGRWIGMRPGDTQTVYAGQSHQLRNDGECAAVMMIAYSSGERRYEEVAQ